MDSSSDYAYYNRYKESKERELSLLKEARRKRNISAFMDFASNLIAQLGRERGVTFSQPPKHAAKYQNIYEAMKSRFDSRFGDYGGGIAMQNLFATLSKDPDRVSVGHGNARRLIPALPKPKKPSLLKGNFQKAVNDYKSNSTIKINNNDNKTKHYVFS
ncbi:MAG: hypothetical protein Q4F44_01520 [Bacteroidales bacterium]|nr:hypothetical protein [Bacteroidales bacterium]